MWEVEVPREAKFFAVGNVQNLGKVIVNQVSFCPFAPQGVSIPSELTLGHLCYLLTDVLPQWVGNSIL